MKRLSALIILLANIALLVHSAVPHYHGDDMIATICHIADDHQASEPDHCCNHEGDESHDSGHCLINDSLMAMACRADHDSQLPVIDFIALPILFHNYFENPADNHPVILLADDRVTILKEPTIPGRGLRAPPVLL